jgi:lipoprotein NlpI
MAPAKPLNYPGTATGSGNSGDRVRSEFGAAALVAASLCFGSAAKAAPADLQACYDANDQQDYDRAIMLCGRAAQSGKLSDVDAARAFNDQGMAYSAKGDQDRAIASFDQAIKLRPDYFEAYYDRAMAHESKDAYEQAIADYSKAIELRPDDATAHYNRGTDRMLIGQYAEAIYDFDQAAQIDADYTEVAAWSKGIAQVNLGQFKEAIDSISRYLAVKPQFTFGGLWLYFAEAGAGRDPKPNLTARFRAANLSEWPGPIVALYMGSATIDEVRAAAKQGEPDYLEDQACHAAFYIGALELISGQTEDGRRDLTEAATTCPKSFFERPAAQVMLDRK